MRTLHPLYAAHCARRPSAHCLRHLFAHCPHRLIKLAENLTHPNIPGLALFRTNGTYAGMYDDLRNGLGNGDRLLSARGMSKLNSGLQALSSGNGAGVSTAEVVKGFLGELVVKGVMMSHLQLAADPALPQPPSVCHSHCPPHHHSQPLPPDPELPPSPGGSPH